MMLEVRTETILVLSLLQRFPSPRQRYRDPTASNPPTDQQPKRVWRVSAHQGQEVHGLHRHQERNRR